MKAKKIIVDLTDVDGMSAMIDTAFYVEKKSAGGTSMGFIPARCTQCGAEINVDDTKDAGICEHCGTPFVTEKVIKNFNIYVSNHFHGATINVLRGNVENLLRLAQSAIESRDGKEALRYANRAIEIQSNNIKSWLVKIQAIYFIGTMSELRATEIVSCRSNAIACANENTLNETKHAMDSLLLDIALDWIKLATKKIADITQLNLMNNIDYGPNISMAYKDMGYRNLVFKYVEGCGELVASIPQEDIENNHDLKKIRELISNEYLKYCDVEKERLSLCKGRLTKDEIKNRDKYSCLLQYGKDKKGGFSYHNDDAHNSFGDGGIFEKMMGIINEK